jgi:hypothetical protein
MADACSTVQFLNIRPADLKRSTYSNLSKKNASSLLPSSTHFLSDGRPFEPVSELLAGRPGLKAVAPWVWWVHGCRYHSHAP